MTLFALTNISGSRILRFPVTQELATELENAFADQYQAFVNDIKEYIPFDGRYRPEEGELLIIEKFEDVDGLAGAVANPLGVDPYDPSVHSLESIKALFSAVEHDGLTRICIQMFEKRRLIATKGLAMYFSKNTFTRMTDSGLTLDNKLLAVLEGTKLIFQSFHFLNRVFDMSDYFNEATAEEVQSFADHQSLKVDNITAFVSSVGSMARKKIALILQSGILDRFTPAQLVAAAQSFKVDIKTADDGRIILPTGGVELRRVLRFLDEDYYESPLTQTRFISNSKRVAD